jgi:hypothetical protein
MTKEYQSLNTAILNVAHPFDGERIRPFLGTPLDPRWNVRNQFDSVDPQPNEHALRQDELMLLKKLMVTYEDNDFIDYLNSLSKYHK